MRIEKKDDILSRSRSLQVNPSEKFFQVGEAEVCEELDGALYVEAYQARLDSACGHREKRDRHGEGESPRTGAPWIDEQNPLPARHDRPVRVA